MDVRVREKCVRREEKCVEKRGKYEEMVGKDGKKAREGREG